jgi:tRNA dimethylallyltransferase
MRAGSMNTSDKQNPRRLIRAIEIAQWKLDKKYQDKTTGFKNLSNVLIIGLKVDRKLLTLRIKERVTRRKKQGMEKEVKRLLKEGVGWETQALDSLGYKSYQGYLKGEYEQNELLEIWEKEEAGYAKRQMTWFGKDKRINWVDITSKSWKDEVEKLVHEWHNTK